VTTTLAAARPEAGTGRTTLLVLAARELRRFVVNPVFLFAVVMTAWTTWGNQSAPVTEIDELNWYPAILLGGFGMTATFWLTRSMRDSEPVVGLVIFGWVNLATVPSLSRPDSLAFTALRQFAPFTHFTYTDNGAAMTTWRGSPWFFLGWQLALCAIAVLAALLRGAEGQARLRIIRALGVAGAVAVVMLVLAATGGFTHAVTA
jgi:hypothetical protein